MAAEHGLPCIEVPMLIHAAIAGDDTAAVPLAAACALVYLGADLFDNVADDELPEEWAGRPAAQVSLAAAAMLAPLPQLALCAGHGAALDLPTRARLSRVLASTLLTMGIGQHEDLLHSSLSGLSVEACRGVSERKGGGEIGGFARAAAILAGASSAVEDAFACFGSCVGTGAQIASDLADLWDPDGSRDLLNGTPTLPIVHAATVLQGRRRVALQQLLAHARLSVAVHPEVRATLRDAGSVEYTMLVVQVYARRACAALERADAREPARQALERMLHSCSLLERRH